MEFDPLQNAPEWIRKQFLDIRHENERFGALRNLFPCTQPCRLGINRSISGHWILPEIAQKHIRIKYCQNWFRFCIIRRNSIMLAAFRGRSWEPIKRSGHSALSESALSECWLYMYKEGPNRITIRERGGSRSLFRFCDPPVPCNSFWEAIFT